jgi:polyvinyl alcohol dehydrogenase (cytochrome)
VIAAAFIALPGTAAGKTFTQTWLTGGQNLQNTRSAPSEKAISPATVGSLAPAWQFATGADLTTGGDVSATPAVDTKAIYFPDSKGHLFAVSRDTGAVLWQTTFAPITGIAGDYARATPAIAGNTLIIGDQAGKFETPDTDPGVMGAYVMGFDRTSGALLWKTRVDTHFTAIVTQAAQVNGNTAYVGVASNEEAFANVYVAGQPYVCCTFRGSVLALDTITGAIKWKTYTVPDVPGYSGGAVWGSTPPVDGQRGVVYAATGNNYSLPVDRLNCINSATTDAAKRACLPFDNHFDSIVALDAKSGAVKWSFKSLSNDAWNVDCGVPGLPGNTNAPSNCPPGAGPDYDFGQGPMLFTAKVGGKMVDLVGAGEKSGDFVTVNRDTGALVWRRNVGPGGVLGGLQWGSATDGSRIYVAESNSTGLARGWWSALDPATGSVLWTSPDPGAGLPPFFGGFYGYSNQGPVSVANGVVYGCSLDQAGNMVGLDAATGVRKWTYPSGSSCIGGAAIADGTVYWGTGYRTFGPLTTGGNKLFAFTPNGG